jgi:hypothetical protein
MEARPRGSSRNSATRCGAFLQLSLDDFLTGQWSEGEELADEGLAIFRSHGFPFYEWYVHAKAIFAAGHRCLGRVRLREYARASPQSTPQTAA